MRGSTSWRSLEDLNKAFSHGLRELMFVDLTAAVLVHAGPTGVNLFIETSSLVLGDSLSDAGFELSLGESAITVRIAMVYDVTWGGS